MFDKKGGKDTTRQEKLDAALQQQLCGQLSALIERLVDLAEAEEAKPATVVAAIREIKAAAEGLQEKLPNRVEIVVKILDGETVSV